jgi:azurin/sugar phosphate isomerase/epimerase
MKFVILFLLVICGASLQIDAAEDLFDRSNLAAWCIVPFDAQKRSPEARAEMVAKMGLTKIAYDWRPEHVAEFEREILAYQKHGIEFFAFWGQHDEAFALFKKYNLSPQLWVMMKEQGATQEEKVKNAADGLLPILEKAKGLGSEVGIYNHGGWAGEPENMVAVCEYLKKNHGTKNVGIVYNLHHGHSHLDRIPAVIALMKPHLLCINLNGMDVAGDTKGRKILPLGVGTEDVKVLRQIRASGYSGPLGILNHTNEDAESRLLDNLDGLAWLIPQLDDATPAPLPKWRSWAEAEVTAPAGPIVSPRTVPSRSSEFGSALASPLVLPATAAYQELPFTIECRAKLERQDRFNILVASEPKASPTHWEIYSFVETGFFSCYLPGRGGAYTSKTDIADGAWHDMLASVGDGYVRLWVDGKMVHEEALREEAQPGIARDTSKDQQIAFGGLVEGGIGCDGIIDDVRLSRGVMKPRKGDSPRLRMDNTLALWSFDELGSSGPVVKVPDPAPFTPELPPLNQADHEHWMEFVNRERVFDFYGKQALHFMNQKPGPDLIPAFPGLDGGEQGHWGNQNDQVTWKDGRWAASDLGSVFSTVFKGAGLTIPKAVCVHLHDESAVFDPVTCMFQARWQGGFIKLNDARHGFMGGGQADGAVEALQNQGGFFGNIYHGFYRHGKEVIFSHAAGDKHYLTTAWQSGRDLTGLTKGGPAQWPQWLETKGELGTQTPFAIDRLTIPFGNPYGTLFFITAHDFFSDGTAAIATMTGEVWLVKGIDEKLETLRWKRFATGLHQPLGVKVVNDQLHVLGRDQITRLHDLNGDDEADFYECVTNAMETSPGGHDFIVGLEIDTEGRWLFASGNQGVCRITGRDQLEVLATGFRNPNGLGLSSDGRFITTSVQEGDWTPATSICQIELGKNEGAHFGAGGPKDGDTPEPVLMYLPRGEDNSASSQAFVSGQQWSALKGDGNLVHLSSGGGSAWLMMRQNVKGLWQGAAVRISGNFDSGPQAARFHPKDGHLYVNGMQGWGSYTPKDGCFQRVRFTGGKPVPIGFEARDNGVLVRFNEPVGVPEASTTFAQCWNYLYSAAYGSPEYSLRYADTPGHDLLEIRSVQRLEDGKALFIEIPQLIPASQVHLHLSTGHDLFVTAHRLGEAFTDFHGYTQITKTNHAAQLGMTAPAASEPNPWTSGESGRAIIVEAALGLQFVQKTIKAKAGERLSLTFKNPDLVPHNWILGKPRTLQSLGEKCNLMITDPQGLAKHYVPQSDDVLIYTDMVNAKGEFTIHFNAPKEPGEYPYLCTFPGHWMVMNGVMTVD